MSFVFFPQPVSSRANTKHKINTFFILISLLSYKNDAFIIHGAAVLQAQLTVAAVFCISYTSWSVRRTAPHPLQTPCLPSARFSATASVKALYPMKLKITENTSSRNTITELLLNTIRCLICCIFPYQHRSISKSIISQPYDKINKIIDRETIVYDFT